MPLRAWLAAGVAILSAACCAPAFAQSAGPSPAIEIPGDGDIALENNLAKMLVDRDLLVLGGSDPRNARAIALMDAGKLGEAEALYRSIVVEELAAPDRDDNYLAGMEMNLAVALQRQHRHDEAERVYRGALERIEWRSDSEQTVYLTSMNLGGLLALHGRFAEAEPLLRRAVAGTSTRRGKGSEHSLAAQLGLAYALLAERKTDELAALLRSVETQISRYNYGGSDLDSRLRRLQCLATNRCRLEEAELRAEASGAMTPGLPGERRPAATN